MAEQYTPNLGSLCAHDARRDAIHIAVAPVVAGHDIDPGDRVGLKNGQAVYAGTHVGIVDPFYRLTVKKGETFWLFLFPGTITGLRHIWSHPAFQTTLKKEEKING